MHSLTDHELIELSKRGDLSATEHLICRYRPLIETRVDQLQIGADERPLALYAASVALQTAIHDYDSRKLNNCWAFADKLMGSLRQLTGNGLPVGHTTGNFPIDCLRPP